jgi:hypothetical protein
VIVYQGWETNKFSGTLDSFLVHCGTSERREGGAVEDTVPYPIVYEKAGDFIKPTF